MKAKYNRFASTAEKNNVHSDMWISDSFLNDEYMVGDTQSHLKLLKQIDLPIPKRFDARARWPYCWSIHQVANQGGCGSCWAMSATSVISDRICIASNYTKQNQISAQDLISCCTKCGGCHGSLWALSAFAFWKENGLVTGGNFGSSEGCKPYFAQTSCGWPCHLNFYLKERTPKCEKKCQELYDRSYEDSLIKGRKAYWIRAERASSFVKNIAKELENLTPDESIMLIKKELILNGPVLVCFTIYEDFQHYHSGIYRPLENSESLPLYGHCVKLIGWGSEGNYSYWQYMNTWGRDWGENGFFRVILSEVPEEVVAGLL